MHPVSRRQALADLRKKLDAEGFDNAAYEARLLLQEACAITALDYTLNPDLPLEAAQWERLDVMLQRRLAHEPLARILGMWEFYGLPFKLDTETLVPRQDTETLVDICLKNCLERTTEAGGRILDLGTGTGCILIALLHENPDLTGFGVDYSEIAIRTARRNAELNEVKTRAHFLVANWAGALSGTFDLIVSNPPYIASSVIPTLDSEVRDFDPLRALDGGSDGLDAYRILLSSLRDKLSKKGALALEIGYDQAESITALSRLYGWSDCQLHQDRTGNDRVMVLRP